MKTINRLLSLAFWIALVLRTHGEPVQEVAGHLDPRWLTTANVDAFVRDNCPGRVVVVFGQGMRDGSCSSLSELRKVIDSDCSHGLVAVGIGSRECPLGGVVEVMMKTCLDEGVIRICGGSAPGYFIFDVAGVLVFQGPRRDEGFVEALEKALREVNDAK